MTYTLQNNGNQTFSVLHNGTPVFTGPLAVAMREHSRLTLAAKGPAQDSTKEQRRQERKQGGQQ